jgi:hypothetical protein
MQNVICPKCERPVDVELVSRPAATHEPRFEVSPSSLIHDCGASLKFIITIQQEVYAIEDI